MYNLEGGKATASSKNICELSARAKCHTARPQHATTCATAQGSSHATLCQDSCARADGGTS
eukprot:7493162-Lingulodinium_polyedra.AAC.1